MRIVAQRVQHASVEIDTKTVCAIKNGILVFLGIKIGDTRKDADYLIRKIINLRMFADEHGKMNKSLQDNAYEMMVISQFTLYGDCTKGRRPSFTGAMEPKEAEKLYDYFVNTLRSNKIDVKTGVFGANMNISLINNGPVTFIIESI